MSKCPYAEKVAKIADAHFDCKDCPALVCPLPEIKAEFEKEQKMSKYTIEQIRDGVECWLNPYNTVECEKCAFCKESNKEGKCKAAVLRELRQVLNQSAEAKADTVREIAQKITKIICDNTYPDFNKAGKPVNVWNAREGYKAIADLVEEKTKEATT